MNRPKAECYICGSKDFRTRRGKVRDNDQLDILECDKCGLVFLSETGHIDKSFYEKSGMHLTEENLPDPDVWLKECAKDDERRHKYLGPLLDNAKLLDFGCGAGGFLIRAKDQCAKAVGVEPEIRLSAHFKSKCLEVYKDIVQVKSRLPRDLFSIITMFHVLEHLPDPRKTLMELSNILDEDGQIIVEVPHANDALLTFYNSESFSRFAYWSCHLFLFNVYSLVQLAKQSGLRVNYIKQVQRYPLSNHLYWLSNAKPGGHKIWHFIDSDELHASYEKQLASIGCCDTLIASFSKKERT